MKLLPRILKKESEVNNFDISVPEFKESLSIKERLFLTTARLMLYIITKCKVFFIKDKVNPINNGRDRIRSQRLLYREYLKRKFCKPNSSGLYFNPYTFLSSTYSFISKRDDLIIGTISAIGDNKFKLPADKLYSPELNTMRSNGLAVMEITALALDSRNFKEKSHSLRDIEKFSSMATLFSGLANWINLYSGASHFIILVNPKHRRIYEFIGFSQFAEIRYYPMVEKPAVPLIIKVEDLFCTRKNPSIAGFITANTDSLIESEIIDFKASEVDWYIRNAPDVFSSMNEQDREALNSIFPELIENLESTKFLDAETQRKIREAVSKNGFEHSTLELVASHLQAINPSILT